MNLNARFTTLLFCCFLGTVNGQSDVWTRKTSLGNAPIGRYGAAAFSINGKGYIGTGTVFTYTRDFWEYDPLTDSWNQKADFPGVAREFALGLGIGDKGYIGLGFAPGGGIGDVFSTDFWQYDPRTNVWLRRADFPGDGRQSPVGFSLLNKAYVGNGFNYNYSPDLNDYWEYDPTTDHWKRKGDFKITGKGGVIGISLNDKGYLINGRDSVSGKTDVWQYDPVADLWTEHGAFDGGLMNGAIGMMISGKGYVGVPTDKNDFWEYNPLSNEWIRQPDFPGVGRLFPFGFGIYDKGYLGSGFKGAFLSNHVDFWEYAPATKIWVSKKSFSASQRTNAVSFSIGNKGYIGTGRMYGLDVENLKNDFWEYDVASDTWSQVANVPASPRESAVAFSIGSKGYVGTGFDHVTFINDLWEFDPGNNLWIQKSAIPDEGRAFAIGFASGGKGYIGLGSGKINYVKNDLWEYNPASDHWVRMSDFPGGQTNYATTFSISSKGYVAVGNDSGLASTELWEFTPASNMWLKKSSLPGPPRYNAVSFSLLNKGYVGLGYGPSFYDFLNDFWQYDPVTDIWSKKSAYPGDGLYGAVGFQVGNKGYVATGSIYVETESDLWEYTPSNEPPISNGWLMKFNSPTSVLLNAWGTYDPEGGPIKYSWTKIAGPDAYNILYGNATTPVISNLINGTYTFRLTVTDDQGATGTSDVTFTITTNRPPVANGWLMKYNSPTSVLLNAWGSHDPEGGPIKYLWTKIEGPFAYTMLYQNSATPVISNLSTGIYQFQLTVTDNAGATGKDTVVVHINPLTQNNRSNRFADESAIGINSLSQLKVFPNPAAERLMFNWSDGYYGAAEVSVIDESGKTLKVVTLNKDAYSYNGNIHLTGINSGSYYLHIRRKDGKYHTLPFIRK